MTVAENVSLGVERAEYGQCSETMLPMGAIAELTQMRRIYDTDGIDELASKIPLEEVSEDGTAKFELINPPTVARFTNIKVLRNYLDEHALYYQEEPHAIGELPVWEGAWHIRVNGHRRERAMTQLNHAYGVADEDAESIVKLLENPTFEQARRNQSFENVYEKPSPVERAEEIEREFRYRQAKQPGLTTGKHVSDVAEYLCCSPDTVHTALLFVTMPSEVKEFVGNGLSYGNVVGLARLRDAYAVKPDSTSEAAEESMRDFFQITVLNRLQGKSTKHIGDVIANKTREVKQQTDYVDGELFIYDVAAEKRAARARRAAELTKAAILTLRLSGELNDTQKAELRALIDIVPTPQEVPLFAV